jgi:hypothetical protein
MTSADDVRLLRACAQFAPPHTRDRILRVCARLERLEAAHAVKDRIIDDLTGGPLSSKNDTTEEEAA